MEGKNIDKKFKRKGFIMARLIMIIIVSGMFTYGVSNVSQNSKVNEGTQNSPDNFVYNRAHNITNSMAYILLTRISDNASFRVHTRVTEDFFGGKATYIVEDTFFENNSLFEIKVTAKFKDVTTIVTTYIDRETRHKQRINVRSLYE